MNKQIKPMYSPGDRVVKSHPTVSFRGTIVSVVPQDKVSEELDKFPAKQFFERAFRKRDKTWRASPIYYVDPNSNYEHKLCSPATFEEAQLIVHGITREQYNMLLHKRTFLAIESDLLPEIVEEVSDEVDTVSDPENESEE